MAFGAVVDALRPDVIVVLNLLRDQLDRYGELDMIEDRWVRDLTGLPAETAIVVCADDPRLESVARRVARARRSRRPIARFGINATGPAASDLEPSVGRDRGGLGTPGVASCPACGGGLVYEGAASAGLGAWACPSCGAHRAALDLAVAIEGVDRDGWLELAFTPRAHDDVPRVRSLRVRLTGTAGAYDAAAAILAARAFGIRWDDAISALDGATPAFGRLEEVASATSTSCPDAREEPGEPRPGSEGSRRPTSGRARSSRSATARPTGATSRGSGTPRWNASGAFRRSPSPDPGLTISCCASSTRSGRGDPGRGPAPDRGRPRGRQGLRRLARASAAGRDPDGPRDLHHAPGDPWVARASRCRAGPPAMIRARRAPPIASTATPPERGSSGSSICSPTC